MLYKSDVLDEFALTTWSMGLMISSKNGSGELEPLSYLDHITDSYSRSNIIFQSYNIIIDLKKYWTQKIHAGLLVTINFTVQVGELTDFSERDTGFTKSTNIFLALQE